MKTSKLQDAEFDQENEEEAGVPADVNAKDDNGRTPLDWASKTDTATLLRKLGGKTGEELKAEGE